MSIILGWQPPLVSSLSRSARHDSRLKLSTELVLLQTVVEPKQVPLAQPILLLTMAMAVACKRNPGRFSRPRLYSRRTGSSSTSLVYRKARRPAMLPPPLSRRPMVVTLPTPTPLPQPPTLTVPTISLPLNSPSKRYSPQSTCRLTTASLLQTPRALPTRQGGSRCSSSIISSSVDRLCVVRPCNGVARFHIGRETQCKVL